MKYAKFIPNKMEEMSWWIPASFAFSCGLLVTAIALLILRGFDGMDPRWTFSIGADIFCLAISVMLCFSCLLSRRSSNEQTKSFVVMLTMISFALFLDEGSWLVQGKPALRLVNVTVNVLFYMNGIILWNYFSKCLVSTSNTFVSNAGIFKKVYFSRLTMPISNVISALVQFIIQFILFIIILIAYKIYGANFKLSAAVFAVPLFVLQMAVLGLGIGLIITSLTTKYRDLTHLVGFAVQLWMYATPIVYPLSMVPEKWRSVYVLNPVVPILEGFKHAFFSTGMPSVTEYGVSVGTTIFLLFAGIFVFNFVEKNFVDTV